MSTNRRPTGRTRLAAAGAVISLGLAACGGDSGVVAPDSDTETTAGATTVVTNQSTAYCQKVLAIETVAEPEIDFESLSPEQIIAESKKIAADPYLPLAREIQAIAPVAVKADIDVLVAAIERVVQNGDYEGEFAKPEVVKAEASGHAFDLSECGWSKVDVKAADYSFSGVPSTLKAGPTSFDFTNGGSEQHEMAILKKKAGVTETFDQIFALDEAEGRKKVDYKGGDDGDPGDEGLYAVQNLEPGSYAMVCFLPVGSTPEAVAAAEAAKKEIGGPPHFIRGMKTEFTVG